MATPDITGEAESLIRALRGVTHARIHASEAGIESVHVTARDDDAARHMAAHVRSALLAGLAAPVVPARIHVDVAPAHDTGAPRDRIRLLHDLEADTDTTDTPDTPDTPHDPDTGIGPDPRAHPRHDAEPHITTRPRLVAVDATRPGDGRVVCRVAIAYRTHVHRAEAVAVDLPGSAAQAAAQATVRALVDAGIAGLELSGLREVEIAGRDYVLVALRRTEPYTRTRSGSAPIIGSAERSAAEATVAAATEFA